MLLPVPYYKQDTTYTCGPTALQMVFHYHGLVESERSLRDALDSEPVHGTKHQALIEISRERGFYCYVNNESSFDELGYFIESLQLPPIVHYVEPYSDEGHYAVVLGFAGGNVVLNDPWNGEHYPMAKREFERRWMSEDGEARQWMMVLSKEEFTIGQHYHPVEK